MACRTGCPTQDHATWGECARAANVGSMYLGGTGPSYGDEKRFRAVNRDYRQAVHDTGQIPAGFTQRAIADTYRKAEGG